MDGMSGSGPTGRDPSVEGQGLEPRSREPKSRVLPLDDPSRTPARRACLERQEAGLEPALTCMEGRHVAVTSLPHYCMGDRSPCRRSQWVDSNHRPPASETGALAKLSYTKMVAVSGLEPLTSCIPSRRALHAAPHHDSAFPNCIWRPVRVTLPLSLP